MHHIPYIANIVILVPVIWTMLRGGHGGATAIVGASGHAPVLQLMVACLWSAILALSVLALTDPQRYWPLLLVQVIYKGMFVALWCVPIWLGRVEGTVPPLTMVFVLIVLIWPFFIVMPLR